MQMIVSVVAQVSATLPGHHAAHQVAPVAGAALWSSGVSQTGNCSGFPSFEFSCCLQWQWKP